MVSKMTVPLAILDALPEPEIFYRKYWNQSPFLARKAIQPEIGALLIEPEELAGLALEDEVVSRMVKTKGPFETWSCEFGPFDAADFTSAGEENWSLLVQNVEQFHRPTADLLRCFKFAPRWMIDDVMVSYSVPGGSVGPHLDSYHVFLVQGAGKRSWKIGSQAIPDPKFSSHPDLKILASSFSGDTVDVGPGDVLYVPPAFAHEGTTLENALTFSVGFLGPKISELYGAYAQHLAENDLSDGRYKGSAISMTSQNHAIDAGVISDMKTLMSEALERDDFASWLISYFTEPAIEVEATDEVPAGAASADDIKQGLEEGRRLRKVARTKLAFTVDASQGGWVAVNGQVLECGGKAKSLLDLLTGDQPVGEEDIAALDCDPDIYRLMSHLFRYDALEWVS